MLVLAFDTSTLQGSVGWIRAAGGDRPGIESFAEESAPASPGHAETLVGRIERVLSTGGLRVEDVDLVVFCRGPGTFTGLRIGLGTAKGLALARGVPILGLPTLEALSVSAGSNGVLVPVVDARRGEIYAAVHRVEGAGRRPSAATLAPERVLRPDGIGDLLAEAGHEGPAAILGNGAIRYRDRLLASLSEGSFDLPARAAAPSAYWMAVLGLSRFSQRGGDDPAAVEPVYLRAPDARLPERPLQS